jgi:ADP-heptose:LPS heptosyltransferase
MSGAKIRVGFHPHTQEGLFRGDFINRPVLYNPYYHISEQFMTLVEAIESQSSPKAKRMITAGMSRVPQQKLDRAEIERFSQRLKRDFPENADRRWILIYPGGGLLPIRAWPLENFCIVAKDFVTHGYTVAVIGLSEDNYLADQIVTRCASINCIDLTGYTKAIRELLILFNLSSLLITNDGGPGHFASMTPIPTIIFYGPETPLLYGPLNSNAVSFHKPLSCSPCLTAYNHRNSPCDGDNVCLKKISPEEVLVKAHGMLKRHGQN